LFHIDSIRHSERRGRTILFSKEKKLRKQPPYAPMAMLAMLSEEPLAKIGIVAIGGNGVSLLFGDRA
jgi:hypothetical protein